MKLKCVAFTIHMVISIDLASKVSKEFKSSGIIIRLDSMYEDLVNSCINAMELWN